jgi:hypothetical protein
MHEPARGVGHDSRACYIGPVVTAGGDIVPFGWPVHAGDVGGAELVHYLESYQFVFRSPKWPQNFLLCMVAPLVPVAGAMVVLGYHFDIIESLHLRPKREYPDFDFDRLLHYLQRGLWPVLVQLIVSLPLAVLGVVLYFGFWFGIMTAVMPGGDPSLVALWLVFGGCALLFFLLVELLVGLFLLPMVLRSGLMTDFGAAFSWTFIRDFLGRMWLQALLAELFLLLTGTALVLAGLLLFGIGVYPAAALVSFARAYLLYELYEEYLRRGGLEITLPLESAP